MREDTAVSEQGVLRHKVKKTQGVYGKESVGSGHLEDEGVPIRFTLPNAQRGTWSIVGAQHIFAE